MYGWVWLDFSTVYAHSHPWVGEVRSHWSWLNFNWNYLLYLSLCAFLILIFVDFFSFLACYLSDWWSCLCSPFSFLLDWTYLVLSLTCRGYPMAEAARSLHGWASPLFSSAVKHWEAQFTGKWHFWVPLTGRSNKGKEKLLVGTSGRAH